MSGLDVLEADEQSILERLKSFANIYECYAGVIAREYVSKGGVFSRNKGMRDCAGLKD